jgi:hypothetical protein
LLNNKHFSTFVFTHQFSIGSKLSFRIDASKSKPIKIWNSRQGIVILNVNGVQQTGGTDFRQGVIIYTDGTYTMIIWIGLTAKSPQEFTVSKK